MRKYLTFLVFFGILFVGCQEETYTYRYRAETMQEYQRLMRGTSIEGCHVRPQSAERETVTRGAGNSWWRVEVTEGRTREIRELFFRAGHHVQRLKRTAIGPIRDNTLRSGEFRLLTEAEVKLLRAVVRTPPKPAVKGRRKAG